MSKKQEKKIEKAEAFTFGDPVSVLDKRDFVDYLECYKIGKYYEPPISLDGLARTFRASVHHSSAIMLKRNILLSCFIPHSKFSADNFSRLTLEWLIFGNGYVEQINNRLGQPLRLQTPMAKYMRRGTDLDRYFWVPGYKQEQEFKKGSIFHLIEPDINQEIYGMPEYIPCLNSAWLNEDATLFRRRYYKNGSHAGFILYMTDAAQQQDDVDALRKALKDSKGPGNFRNLFMYAPNGKKDGIQLIPVSEVSAKDEFFNIKNVTRDDQLAMHRTPPQLLGVVPSNTGGFGDIEKAAAVFATNELPPLQERLKQLNEWVGEEIIKFKPYEIVTSNEGQQSPRM